MSWSLYCFNAGIRVLSPINDPGSTIDAGDVYVETEGTYGTNAAFSPEAMFHVGTSEKILANTYQDKLMYSSDGGASWADVGNVPNWSTSRRASRIDYRASDDTWFLTTSRSSASPEFHYSQDNGATWTQFGSGIMGNNATRGMWVDESGRVVVASRDTDNDGIIIHRFNDPVASGTYSTQQIHSGAVTVANVLEDPASDSYLVVANTSNNNDMVQVPRDFTSAITHYDFDWGAPVFASMAHNGTDKFLSRDTDSASASATLGVAVWQDGDVSLSTQSETFSENNYLLAQVAYGDRWLLTCKPSADPVAYLMMKWSDTGEDGTWSSETQINTDSNLYKYATDDAKNEHHIEYMGSGKYMLGYIDVSGYLRLATFDFGSNPQGDNTGPVSRAIESQLPDIFLKMDDANGVSTVVDIGRKNYTNVALSTNLTFELPGLVSDGGTAVFVDSTTDTGVYHLSVPAPVNHSHVFIFKQDGTSAQRILASAGDFSDTDEISYYIFLHTDDTVGVSVYDGGWTTNYSSTAITDNTATLMAVTIDQANSKVIIYIENDQDKVVTSVTLNSISGQNLGVLGGWNGDNTMSNCADGVTLDYYALIENANFNYVDILEAWGGSYNAPAADTGDPGTGTLELLIHAEDSVLPPSGDLFTFTNSGDVANVVYTGDRTGRLSTTKKFGSQGVYIPSHTLFSDSLDPKKYVWSSNFDLAQRDFTFDVWVKGASGNTIVPIASTAVQKRSGNWIVYGGLGVYLRADPRSSGTGEVTLYVLKPFASSQIENQESQLKVQFRQIPGYTHTNWNHFVLCRKMINGVSTWYVFLNGRKEASRAILTNVNNAYTTGYIYQGGPLNIGAMTVIKSDGTRQGRFQQEMYFDEARFVLDEAIFTEEFTPPTSAYS